jgi:glycosyltransferase involved in cell wall biosynthesis
MINKPLITILTVNYNTSDFIALMLYSLKKLTRNSYKIIICDNGSSFKDRNYLINIVKKFQNINLIFREQSKAGSIGHAEALDRLIFEVNTPYFAVLDSDALFLLKGWDELLLSKINDKTKCIGTPIVPNPIKPTDFPLMFATMYETNTFKSLNCSFMPDMENIYQGKDTGWQVREKFLNSGYKGENFNVYNTRHYKKGTFQSVLCSEYYLEGVEHIIASHFGRGSSGGVNKYNNRWYFKLPIVNKLFRKLQGKKEKQEWMIIAKKIVDKQK